MITDITLILCFVAALTVASGLLLTPAESERKTTLTAAQPTPSMEVALELIRSTSPAVIEQTWESSKLSNRWRWIVVHHSATISGSAKAFDRYHAEERKMVNGLAYHFVIGNGTGSVDGFVETGNRWRKQLDGGHVKGDELNRISIGVCLVGDFRNHLPTGKQIASLKALLNYLTSITGIDPAHVSGHSSMKRQTTACPGTFLPLPFLLRHVQQQGPQK